MIGAPRVTPITGPPAPTIDHQPMALTRSSGANIRKMRAIDAVPVAAPWMPSRQRAKSSTPTLGAVAVRTAATMAPPSPHRYRRRYPKRSPAFPNSGAAKPNASRGPVETQVSTE